MSYDFSLTQERASCPLSAVSMDILVFFRRFFMTSRFILVSSTTSIEAEGAVNRSTYFFFSWTLSSLDLMSPTGSSLDMPCLIVNEKAEPSPYTLSTDSSLSMRLRRLSVILSPSPVPSMVRFLFSSILSKGLKSLSLSSSLMPIPVSLTST